MAVKSGIYVRQRTDTAGGFSLSSVQTYTTKPSLAKLGIDRITVLFCHWKNL
jgi:hypothetical protein